MYNIIKIDNFKTLKCDMRRVANRKRYTSVNGGQRYLCLNILFLARV